MPVDNVISHEGSESPRNVAIFCTCVVRRAMCRTSDCSGIDKTDREREPVFSVSTFPLPLSCSDLAKEQRNFPIFQALYSQVLSDHEVDSAVCGYLLQDRLLLRKWLPQGDCFVGDRGYANCTAGYFKADCASDCL